MKKIVIFILMMVLIPIKLYADDIYNINMDIKLQKDGSALITEIWDVKASSGTEWYKTIYDLNKTDSVLTDFKVKMDNKLLKEKNWDVDETLNEKSGYYGTINKNGGVELCFGKSDFKRHKFELSYKVSNYIFNVSDAQVLAWTVMPKITVDFINVTITGFYNFPNTLDVWGYGYKGYAYVKDGKITLQSENGLNGEYITVLVKFPKNTFETVYQSKQYSNFEEVYNKAEEGSFSYDYEEESRNMTDVGIIIFVSVLTGVLLILSLIKTKIKLSYGYKGNKTITRKNTPMFRDIPCNKDIYYANALIELNDFSYSKTNILGAIILKWVKENKVKFVTKKNIFNREKSAIELNIDSEFEKANEGKLFRIMYDASNDGVLEQSEFEKWAKNNYSKFLGIFNDFNDDLIFELKRNGEITKRNNKNECRKENVMSEKIFKDSSELFGLKLFFETFSNMKDKSVIDVHLWDEYLMFAYLFDCAEKVSKQLKKLYPEIIENQNFNYNNIAFVSSFAYSGIRSANMARSAAQRAARSYSSGGGGFSSGGGGGGFSGGGGSAGGR